MSEGGPVNTQTEWSSELTLSPGGVQRSPRKETISMSSSQMSLTSHVSQLLTEKISHNPSVLSDEHKTLEFSVMFSKGLCIFLGV